MGQVLGFSHCKEFGSVSSTPDSTPPCTDGGNEESDFPELQTALEWSEDEDGPEDEDGGASSPSIWGTPRQNSFELTFSYIAFAETEGSSRREGASAARRRATGTRGGRASLNRVDTVETLLLPDSRMGDWDPHFLSEDGEEGEGAEDSMREERRTREEQPPMELQAQPWTTQPFTLRPEQEVQVVATGSEAREEEDPDTPPGVDSQSALPLPESEPAVASETASYSEGALCMLPCPIGQNTQEEATRDQWFSTINLSEGTLSHYEAVMDLLYWKDTERTGLVFTGLVVALLSLFQLSIITVFSTLALAIMCFTISVRVYYGLLHAIQWGDGVHPFQSYLDLDVSFSGDEANRYIQRAILLTCSAVDAVKRLFFVSSLCDSLKFLLLMYLVTYLGNLCNGLTLLITGVIAVFSLPVFYKQHQEKVDSVVAAVRAHTENIKDILYRLSQGGGISPDSTPGGAKPKVK